MSTNIYDIASKAGVRIADHTLNPPDDDLDVFVKIECKPGQVVMSPVDINGVPTTRVSVMTAEGAEAVAALLMKAAQEARSS